MNKENPDTPKDLENDLTRSFGNGHSISEWEEAAKEELNGASPWEKLTYQTDGLSILPFYYSENQPDTLLPVSENLSGPRSWYNCPLIKVTDEVKANEMALQCLQEGADGILFELEEVPDFRKLLSEIQWKYCSLNFLAKKNQTEIAKAIDSYISDQKLFSHETHGAFFGNISPSFVTNKKFFFSGFAFQHFKSPVEELVNGFTQLAGQSLSTSTAISLTLDNDFFSSIAKQRAARVVWKSLSKKLNQGDNSIYIHALSTPWIEKSFQPHGNMLKATYSAMAAIVGGSDAITILAEDENNSTMSRAARNISNVLREESHFSKVADPLAGSYFIEELTMQIADKVLTTIG